MRMLGCTCYMAWHGVQAPHVLLVHPLEEPSQVDPPFAVCLHPNIALQLLQGLDRFLGGFPLSGFDSCYHAGGMIGFETFLQKIGVGMLLIGNLWSRLADEGHNFVHGDDPISILPSPSRLKQANASCVWRKGCGMGSPGSGA